MIASEASPALTISPHLQGVETETFLAILKMSEQKGFLQNTLKKYNAKSPEDIEIMIEQSEIGEHPAYEDYLSALSYEQNINDLENLLYDLVKRI